LSLCGLQKILNSRFGCIHKSVPDLYIMRVCGTACLRFERYAKAFVIFVNGDI